jgi:hypothetical protein
MSTDINSAAKVNRLEPEKFLSVCVAFKIRTGGNPFFLGLNQIDALKMQSNAHSQGVFRFKYNN